MEKMKDVYEVVMTVIGAVFVFWMIASVFIIVLHGTSNSKVLKMDTTRQKIESKLESESKVIRAVAESEVQWYNGRVVELQRNNKNAFIGSFISDAVDALEKIKID